MLAGKIRSPCFIAAIARSKKFCRQLQILPDYLQQHGCNQAVKNDLLQILNYFNQAAPLHHADEEQDLFPTLRNYASESQQKIQLLEQQHHQLDSYWQQLKQQLESLLQDNQSYPNADLIRAFIQGYAEHIAVEEPLFELAKEKIPANVLKDLGKNMAARRKI